MKRKLSEMLEEGLKDFAFRVLSSLLIGAILCISSVFILHAYYDHGTVMHIVEGIACIGLVLGMIMFCFLKL